MDKRKYFKYYELFDALVRVGNEDDGERLRKEFDDALINSDEKEASIIIFEANDILYEMGFDEYRIPLEY